MLNFSKVVFFNIIVDTKHMFYLDYCKLKLKDMKDIYSPFGEAFIQYYYAAGKIYIRYTTKTFFSTFA